MSDLGFLRWIYKRYSKHRNRSFMTWNLSSAVEKYPFLVENGIVEKSTENFYRISDWDKLAYLVEILEM